MKKKVFALFLVAVMVLGVTACGGNSEPKPAEEQDATNTTELEDFTLVLDWYPNAVHGFLYDAIEKGYFAEEGLNLVIQFPSNPNDGISLPAAKKADAGIYYLQDAILTAAEENVPVTSIGAIVQEPLNVVIALEESGIKEPKDLVGKKIGYGGTVLAETQMKVILEDAGLTTDDCKFIDVGFDLMSALTTGQVDATTGNMVNHEVPQMEEQGFAVNYFYPTQYGVPSTYEMIFLANKDAVAQNTQKYQKFLRACQKGFADMKQNPDEVLKILLDNQNEANFPLSENVEHKSMEMLLPKMETENGKFLHQEVSVWQENADWLYEKGVLSEKTDVSDMVVNVLETE